MDPSQLPVKRIVLRAVLKGVSPLVARVLSVPDSLALTHFHEAFLAVLGWRSDPDFIIRVHGQQFTSLRRRSRGVRLRDLQLRRQETFLYICDLLDLWEWEVRVLEVDAAAADDHKPVCLKGRGAAPPELCGGPTGYRLMLRRQTAGPRLADPATIAASVTLMADTYGKAVEGIDWERLKDTLATGWTSVEARPDRTGPLTPTRFGLKETNERLAQWWQRRGE